MSTESTHKQNRSEAPSVHYHAGEDLRPVERGDLPHEILEEVDRHVEFTGAYEVEVRYFGNGVVNVTHRYARGAGGADG